VASFDTREFTLRVGPATCLPVLARSFGRDPAPALAAAELDEKLFASPENRVSIAKLGKFAFEIARLTRRPDLGLLVAESYGPHSLGLVLALAEEGPDVRTALLNIVYLLKHNNEFAYLSLAESGNDAVLSYELRETEFEGADIVLVSAIGTAFRVLCRFCGHGWCPAEVRLSMTRPKNIGPYEKFFSAPVRFDSAMDALVFPRHWLDHPVTAKSPTSSAGSLPPSAWDFTDHVRHQIAMRIGREPVTAWAIAAAMGLSRRTLDRRLSGLGVSFAQLVDEIRFARARRLLASGRLPFSDVSFALGYGEPSSFSRAFRAWAGCSPQDWRSSGGRNLPPDP
jgi:AraC-like DNA-binding protein